MNSFIERVEIYPERLQNGRILKHIEFRFPVILNRGHVSGIDWDDGKTVETVMLFAKF